MTISGLLQRFEPYTTAFIHNYGGLSGEQDDPDRIKNDFGVFLSNISQPETNSELIPEFFFLPEVYQNRNKFFAGFKNSTSTDFEKANCDEMKLPAFAENAFDLVRILR